ncbi:unnamed protein product, partial [Heterotrigona itama]
SAKFDSCLLEPSSHQINSRRKSVAREVIWCFKAMQIK